MSYEQVLEAFKLSDDARDFVKNVGRDVGVDEVWSAVFAPSPLVDVERTRREGGAPLARVFLRSPYGLQYRADYKDWIPFRHGEVKIEPLQLQGL